MTPKVDAVLKVIGSSVAAAQTSCMLNAFSGLSISVNDSGTVDISNTTIDNRASSHGACAAQSVDLAAVLDRTLQAAPDHADKLAALKADVREAITVSVTQTCGARAVNEAAIRIANVPDTVRIDGLQVSMLATAQITECLGQVLMRDGSTLAEYLQGNASWLQVSADGTVYPPASACPEWLVPIRGLAALAGALVLGLVLILLAVSARHLSKSK